MSERGWVWLHLVAVIAWVGPSIGAWWMYVQARREGLAEQAIDWFERVVAAEHLAFIVLLGTGVGMALRWGLWPDAGWLRWKIALVAAVVVPIELVDVWIAHVWLPRARRRYPQRALRRFDRWLLGAGLPLMGAVALILYLAVVKPN